jgi:peptide/nickel transport system substrate-binding protein
VIGMRRSAFRLAAVLVAMLTIATACGKSKKATTATGGKVSKNLIVGTTDSLQNSFDPAEAYDFLGGNLVVPNVAETLVTYSPNATKPSPLLATALPSVSADGLTYTFPLRAGVKFSDGTPMDSAAVKFSLERAEAFGAKDNEAAGFLLAGIKSIATPSATSVVITLSKPDVTFLSRLAYSVASIVSPTAYKDNVLTGSESGTSAVTAKYKTDTIVGTGPYKLVSYKEKESIEFQANPDYWGTKPKTNRVLVRLYDKASALKLALQNHEVDVAYRTLQPDDINSFRSAAGFKVVEGNGPGIRYLVFNVNTKPWDNVNMRRAVAAAIDRNAVVSEVFKGTVKPLASMVPPPFPTSDSKWTALYGNADTAKVNQYLAAAGVPAGQKIPIDFWFSPTHYGDTEASVAQVVARSLEATGRFTVKISNVEWAEYGQKRRAGEMPVFLMGWYPDYIDEDDYLEPFADKAAFDPAKWTDPKMLDLVQREEVTLDATQRASLITQGEDYMADQVPYVPIFQIAPLAATTDRVAGVVLDPIQVFRLWLIEKRT